MRFADELVTGRTSSFDARVAQARASGGRDGGQAVDSLHEDFDPGKRKDEYREAVLDMIERKAAGKKPRKPPKEKPPEETPDLMAALEASLAGKR